MSNNTQTLSEQKKAALAAVNDVLDGKTEIIEKNPVGRPPKQETFKKKKEAPKVQIFRMTVKWSDDIRRTSNKQSGAPFYFKTSDVIRWPYRRMENGDMKPISIHERDNNGGFLNLEEENVVFQPRTIRYVVGEPSIFADEQAITLDQNGRNQLLDNPSNRDNLVFSFFEKRVASEDTTTINYLWCMGQCENQHPYARRNGSVKTTFQLLDFGQTEERKVELGKLREKCYRIATNARDEEMIPHAKYLGINFEIADTGEERDIAAIREDYKDKAYMEPELFDKTFGDAKVKLIYYITNAQRSGELGIGTIKQGQAHWSRTGKFICLLPPDKNPIDYLAEYSLTEEGTEFGMQLRSFNITK